MSRVAPSKRLLGITVLGHYILNGGIDGILDNLIARPGASSATRHGVWLNRYGHLSDEELDAVGRIRREAA